MKDFQIIVVDKELKDVLIKEQEILGVKSLAMFAALNLDVNHSLVKTKDGQTIATGLNQMENVVTVSPRNGVRRLVEFANWLQTSFIYFEKFHNP